MPKSKSTLEQRRLEADLWLIVAITIAVFAIYLVVQSQAEGFIKNKDFPVLARTLAAAAVQFGIAGLGITVVSIIRKESFFDYGLKAKGAVLSIVLCSACFVPYVLFVFATNQAAGYLPFQSVWTARETFASGFPFNAAGTLVIATAWGFFEGFNYVVISDKINKRYPSKNKWLNWGAIFCAAICILIHGLIGVTFLSVIEMLTVVIIIYGMLMVKEFTKNAWGCVFIFIFLWNAF